MVDLPDISFYGLVLRDPDEQINCAEYTEVTQDSHDIMGHPPHEVCDGKSYDGANEQMRNSHPQQAPSLCFPDDGGASPYGAINNGKECLQKHGVHLAAAVSDQLRHNGIKTAVCNDQRDQDSDQVIDS